MGAVLACALIPVTAVTKRREEISCWYRSALVGRGQVASVEDPIRHPEEEVDDPADDGHRHDEPGHDRIHEADEGEDDDRDDPGPPPDPPDMPKDRPEAERLEEPSRVSEPHDRKHGYERYDDPDDGRDHDPGDGSGDGRSPDVGVVEPPCRYGGDRRNPPEDGQDQDHGDQVDEGDDVQLPPIDKEPAPLVHVGGGPPSGEHPDDVAIVERD